MRTMSRSYNFRPVIESAPKRNGGPLSMVRLRSAVYASGSISASLAVSLAAEFEYWCKTAS